MLSFKPSLEETEKIAKNTEYKTIPLCAEIYSDFVTPLQVLRILKNAGEHCFMLESAEDKERWGRYTFLGFNPKMGITCRGGKICIDNGVKLEYETETPDVFIRNILAQNRSPSLEHMPPFTGGLVGYFSYDFAKYTERALDLDAQDNEELNDVDLMLFDKVIAFDRYKQKIIIIANIKTSNLNAEYEKGKQSVMEIIQLIQTGSQFSDLSGALKSEFKMLYDKEQYCEMVNKAKGYIKEGDIFQVVLSNRIEADFEGSLLNTYRVMRTSNPSPYMFYMSGSDIEIAGASPETLVKLKDDTLYTFPLAGTRKRGETPEEDMDLEHELKSDEKELAEHNMLVDLGRNDLGKISRFGTVEVEKHLSVERFSHVMHLGSTVRGIIKDGKSGIDAINAVLPAGTLSGAPKIRAMQIINELENNKRGVYGGAIGYLDFSGNIDTCIAIRFVFKKNGRIYIRSGAGIVHDSVPENEYEECKNKAKAVLEAVKTAQGGLCQ